MLLDTHAIIWIGLGLPLKPAALDAVEEARRRSELRISAVSAWEIGLLVAKGRLALTLDPEAWLDRFIALSTAGIVPLTATVAVRSAFLPGGFHADPADRLLVATARDLGIPIVTRDQRILAYAAAGHVAAVGC